MCQLGKFWFNDRNDRGSENQWVLTISLWKRKWRWEFLVSGVVHVVGTLPSTTAAMVAPSFCHWKWTFKLHANCTFLRSNIGVVCSHQLSQSNVLWMTFWWLLLPILATNFVTSLIVAHVNITIQGILLLEQRFLEQIGLYHVTLFARVMISALMHIAFDYTGDWRLDDTWFLYGFNKPMGSIRPSKELLHGTAWTVLGAMFL